jgi:glutamate-ammonia-ligase adenylyltransferase
MLSLPRAVLRAGRIGGDRRAALAERELIAQHGRCRAKARALPCSATAAWAAKELGFASDLDLVFVYDGQRAQAMSDGAASARGCALVSAAGAARDELADRADPRRSSVRSRCAAAPGWFQGFAGQQPGLLRVAYQKSRAWTWEHQALLRARPVAGDAVLNAELAEVRRDTLAVPRDRAAVLAEVSSMRQRWRAERDRSECAQLDLKQGHGGLLDIEFALQGLGAGDTQQRTPVACRVTANAGLIEACRDVGLLDTAQARFDARARELLRRALPARLICVRASRRATKVWSNFAAT